MPADSLAVVEVVLAPLLLGGEVRHEHVGSGEKAQLPATRVQYFQSGGGGDVDVGHQQAQESDHLQSEQKAFLFGWVGDAAAGQRGVRVGVVGPHADHRGVEFPVEQQVAGEVLGCLPGETDHGPGAGLEAAFLELLQGPEAAVEAVVGGMDPGIEVRIGGLDAKEIAVRAGREPFLVDLPGLLPERERDAEGRIAGLRREGLDGPDEAGNLLDKGPVRALSALDDDRAEALLRCRSGRIQHLVFRQLITPAADIPADAAVEAVLDAAVGYLDKAAKIYFRPHRLALDAVRLVQQGPVEFRIPASQRFRETLAATKHRAVYHTDKCTHYS